MRKNKGTAKGGSQSSMDFEDRHFDIRTISKEIELLGFSCMTWKDKKDLQNKKVVSLGGKPPKKQRLPLSVARVVMKKQKEREQKMLQQNMLLGESGESRGRSTRQLVEKSRPEDMPLRSSEGRFKNGVLDVKHLLRPVSSSRDSDRDASMAEKSKKKKKGHKKNKGKKKGRGRKRH